MSTTRVLLYLSLFLHTLTPSSEAEQAAVPLTTLHVRTRLVFLDTTVIDKQGHIVTSGLTKDDFMITEEKQPRTVSSFEPPEKHEGNQTKVGGFPVTVFILDQLNGSFQDFASIRRSLQEYLERQPSVLQSPSELMLLGYHSLQMVHDFTRSKAELFSALNRIAPPPSLAMATGSERFNESIYALQLVALQNQGVPDRKNVVWVGYGAPIAPHGPDREFEKMIRLTHETTNMLVDARISLFLVYPGFPGFQDTGGSVISRRSAVEAKQNALSFSARTGGGDPFASDIRFSAFASATGGDLFYRNDVDRQVERASALGTNYYTLTYQPQQVTADGRFRNVRVTMRDPNLKAITKTGYFAADPEDLSHPAAKIMENLTIAVRAEVPMHGLNLRIDGLRWRPDTGTAQFDAVLEAQSLRWRAKENGDRTTNLFFAVASLRGPNHILTTKYQEVELTTSAYEATLAGGSVKQRIEFHVPAKTTSLHFVLETEDGDRLGSGEITRDALDRAPRATTPNPVLIRRPEN